MTRFTMRKRLRPYRSIFREVLIILLFAFTVNNYIGHPENTIAADGIGYYDYLPSVFIHDDFFRKDVDIEANPAFYARLNQFPEGMYNVFDGRLVNKYPIGTALLEAPFFLVALNTTTLEGNFSDGYQHSFHLVIYTAAAFYLFLGLIFFRKLLELYDVHWLAILTCQVLLVFGTNLFYYTGMDSGFSHVYSFFAVSAFLYFAKRYFSDFSGRAFVWACFFLALILLLRQVNVLVLLSLPFLAGSFPVLKEGVLRIFAQRKPLILGLAILLLLVSLQFLALYAQSGQFFLYTYKGEGFNLLQPEILNVLFSYRKGLFLYTPILLLSFVALVRWLVLGKYYLAGTWFLFFSALTFVVSSWWAWYYGCSFGHRPFIDFFPLFFVPIALLLNAWKRFSFFLVPVFAGAIFLNLVQSYQYRFFILDWQHMDKAKYWKVFLETEERFEGSLYKTHASIHTHRLLHIHTLDQVYVPGCKRLACVEIQSSDIPDFNQACLIRVELQYDYPRSNDNRVTVEVRDTTTLFTPLWDERALIHYAEGPFDTPQLGLYDYSFEPTQNDTPYKISVLITTQDRPLRAGKMRVLFYAKKP